MVIKKSKAKSKAKKVVENGSLGQHLDASMDPMEETRLKKKFANDLTKLSKAYHFNFTEIESLFILYYKLAKLGPDFEQGVTKTQFRDILHCTLDMTDDTLMDRIFLTIDKSPQIFLSLDTFVKALSLFLRGTLEEKIRFCFTVYDSTPDGLLGREQIFNLLKKSLISTSGVEDAEEAVRDLIEILTKKMDIDRDGKISFNDYRQTVLKNPMLLEAFGSCLPSRRAVYGFLATFVRVAHVM